MKSRPKKKATVSELAASIGDKVVAKTAKSERMQIWTSRRHNGRFKGSFGSSEGCGTRSTGTPLLRSYLRLGFMDVEESFGRDGFFSSRSRSKDVPRNDFDQLLEQS